jgi:hypothetical protein
MLAVALVSVSSLLVPAPARSLGRRELLLPLPLVLLAPANSAASAREPAAEPLISDGMRVLLTKAKALRGYVANTAAARRSFPMDPDPEVNNYLKLKDAVERAQATVLLPLLAALERKAGAAQLPEEQQKQLAQQPLLLKGHLLELEQALALEEGFAAYVSKSTGVEYRGGKVERELEEVGETCDEFFALALARSRRGETRP